MFFRFSIMIFHQNLSESCPVVFQCTGTNTEAEAGAERQSHRVTERQKDKNGDKETERQGPDRKGLTP